MSNRKKRPGISHRLQQLEARVRALEDALAPSSTSAASRLVPMDVAGVDLPNSLAKSLQAMRQLGEADATAVSQKTERNRSVETIYLNQLVRLGALTRSRVGKKVFFRLAKVY